MSSQGTATINFGSKSTDTSVAVSAPSITGGQLVEAWIFPTATATNTADDHWVEGINVIAGNVQAGVGFTIYAKVDEGWGHGSFTVGWVYN
jgi:hypothetical protein